MKVRKLLELQALIEERKIPCDMTDNFKYWSKSKSDWVSILDMDLIHVVRALNRLILFLSQVICVYSGFQEVTSAISAYSCLFV